MSSAPVALIVACPTGMLKFPQEPARMSGAMLTVVLDWVTLVEVGQVNDRPTSGNVMVVLPE
jgi:hypothetical protein